jgi:hypothetical protein
MTTFAYLPIGVMKTIMGTKMDLETQDMESFASRFEVVKLNQRIGIGIQSSTILFAINLRKRSSLGLIVCGRKEHHSVFVRCWKTYRLIAMSAKLECAMTFQLTD